MVIGIGGASRSGKTRLTKLLKEHLSGEEVLTLCQDDYVYPISQIPTIHDRIDWECPESINFESLYQDLTKAIANYDHVIVEGFLIFHQSELLQLFDKSIFIQIDKKTFTDRRIEDTRWEDEPDWYIAYVWKSYLKHGQMTGKNDYLTINGTAPIRTEDILKYIQISVH